MGVGLVARDKAAEPWRLLQLARETAPESRFALATSITDLYAERGEGFKAREEEMIEEILDRLVRAFELDLRKALAERLAKRPRVPHGLILMLADDDIEVAGPILRDSLLLAAADLIDIIERHGEGHQLAIAERKALDESVSEALVGTSNVVVIETLLRNPGAKLKSETLSHLVDEARWVERYREPLSKREDLTESLARKLLGLVSNVLRQQILQNFEIDPDSLDQDLEAAVDERVEPIVERSGDELRALPEKLSGLKRISPQLLIRILRRGDFAMFQSLLGELACISKDRLTYILAQPDSRSFAVICKALGFAKPDFAVMLFMIRQQRGVDQRDDPRSIARLIEFFGELDPKECFDSLKRWRRDPAYQQAIDDFEDIHPAGPTH